MIPFRADRPTDSAVTGGALCLDVLDQMCRSVCHAPRRTRGTNASAFAREGNQDLIVARLATDADEAMGEDAAAQILGELALDVARQAAAVGIA